MKRISILATVLMGGVVYGAGPMHGGHPGRPGRVVQPVRVVAGGHRVQQSLSPSVFFYVSGGTYSDQVQYSPYAFQHGSNGLIPSYLNYNPYALEYGRSGLVPDTMQWNPYAFDNKHSGLISQIPCGYLPGGTYPDAGGAAPSYGAGACGPGPVFATAPYVDSRYRPRAPEKPALVCGPDQLAVVRAYLDQVCPGRYKIAQLLRINNAAVCFDVVLLDKKVVIKYWNGPEIETIKRQSDFRQKAYTRYLIDWVEYRDEFESNGGKVFHVASDDTYELLSELGSYLQTDAS